MSEKKSYNATYVGVRMPDTLLESLDNWASSKHMNRSAAMFYLISTALANELRNDGLNSSEVNDET